MQQTAKRARRRKHYIAEWAARQKIGPAAIIAATGADKSVVSRWLAGSEPRPEYLEALATRLGVPSARLYELPPDADVRLSAPVEIDPTPPPYGGIVKAGRFRPVDEYFNQDEDWNIPPGVVRHPGFPRVRQYVWRAEGDSMTEAGILDGMWIVGADAGDWADQYGEIESGKLVVVQHTRHDGAERELTVKEIRFYRDRSELLPRSKNPEYKPLVVKYDHAVDNGEEVKVIGLVLWAGFDFTQGKR